MGVGYRATLKGKQLNLQLGFSHDINYNIPENIKITVEKQTVLKISVVPTNKKLVWLLQKLNLLDHQSLIKAKVLKEKGQYILRKEGKKK